MHNNSSTSTILWSPSKADLVCSLVRHIDAGRAAFPDQWRESLRKEGHIAVMDGDGKGYFVKLSPNKEWTADLPDDYHHQIMELRAQFRDFDIGLKTILFGHAGTHVYVFERGYVAHFEGTAEDSKHPLNKASAHIHAFWTSNIRSD